MTKKKLKNTHTHTRTIIMKSMNDWTHRTGHCVNVVKKPFCFYLFFVAHYSVRSNCLRVEIEPSAECAVVARYTAPIRRYSVALWCVTDEIFKWLLLLFFFCFRDATNANFPFCRLKNFVKKIQFTWPNANHSIWIAFLWLKTKSLVCFIFVLVDRLLWQSTINFMAYPFKIVM